MGPKGLGKFPSDRFLQVPGGDHPDPGEPPVNPRFDPVPLAIAVKGIAGHLQGIRVIPIL